MWSRTSVSSAGTMASLRGCRPRATMRGSSARCCRTPVLSPARRVSGSCRCSADSTPAECLHGSELCSTSSTRTSSLCSAASRSLRRAAPAVSAGQRTTGEPLHRQALRTRCRRAPTTAPRLLRSDVGCWPRSKRRSSRPDGSGRSRSRRAIICLARHAPSARMGSDRRETQLLCELAQLALSVRSRPALADGARHAG